MLLLPIILSLGAVYAFIPVIIIIILLLAARGSIGKGFFDIFALSSIVGWSKGIGGTGAGKGLGKTRYIQKHNAAMNRAAKGIGDTFLGKQDKVKQKVGKGEKGVSNEELKGGNYGLKHAEIIPTKDGKGYKYSRVFRGALQDTNDLSKRNLMAIEMKGDPKEIRNMLKQYGLEKKANNLNDNKLIDFAVYELSLREISKYYNTNIKPNKKSGTPPPPKAPQGKGGLKEGVKMAVDFYKTYYKARSGHIVTYREANDILKATSSMSTEQLTALLKKKGINVTPDMDRGRLSRLAVTAVSVKEMEDFVNKNPDRSNKNQNQETGQDMPDAFHANKLDLMKGMTADEIKTMLGLHQVKAAETADKDEMADYAAKNLAIGQIKDFKKNYTDEQLEGKIKDEGKAMEDLTGDKQLAGRITQELRDGGYSWGEVHRSLQKVNQSMKSKQAESNAKSAYVSRINKALSDRDFVGLEKLVGTKVSLKGMEDLNKNKRMEDFVNKNKRMEDFVNKNPGGQTAGGQGAASAAPNAAIQQEAQDENDQIKTEIDKIDPLVQGKNYDEALRASSNLLKRAKTPKQRQAIMEKITYINNERSKEASVKLGLMKGMSADEIQIMFNSYGVAAIDTIDRGELAKHAASNLTAEQIQKFKDKYYGMKTGEKANGLQGGASKQDKDTRVKLGLMKGMSADEIQIMFNSYGVAAIDTIDRDKLARYAASNLTVDQINKFIDRYYKK